MIGTQKLLCAEPEDTPISYIVVHWWLLVIVSSRSQHTAIINPSPTPYSSPTRPYCYSIQLYRILQSVRSDTR